MKFEDVKVGMRVVPFQKSIGSKFASCNHWNSAKENNQLYLYVVDIKDTHIIILNERINCWPGNYYLAQDIEPYIEGDVNMKYKKEDLNSCMLFKTRNYGLCVLLEINCEQNKLVFYNQSMINNGCYGCLSALSSYNEDFKDKFGSEYDIIAIKQYDSCNEVLHMVLNDKEPEEWDWVRIEKTEQEIQLEDLIEKLSGQLTDAQKQLEIIKENK